MTKNPNDGLRIDAPNAPIGNDSNSNLENPYNAPQADMEKLRQMLATNDLIKSGFKIILGSAAFCGFLGGAIGLALGILIPGYYRAVFRQTPGEIIEWQIGLGLGLTQGVVGGAIIGSVVLLSAAWYKSRVRASVDKELGNLGKE